MTSARRLNVWRAVVIVAFASNVTYAAVGAFAAAIVSIAALVGMLALLVTTPRDAIVLSRGRSEGIIVGGWLIAAAIATRADLDRAPVACVALAIGIALLGTCRLRSISAWWAAVALWQPVVLMLIKMRA